MGEIGANSLLGLPPVEKMAASREPNVVSTDKGNVPSLAKSLSAEIDMKLFYLDLINEMEQKLNDSEKRLQLVRQDNVTMKKLLAENLKNCGEENIVSKTEEEFFSNLGVTNDDGVPVDMGDNRERKIIPQGPCMTFTNLFDLAGQVGFSFIFAR